MRVKYFINLFIIYLLGAFTTITAQDAGHSIKVKIKGLQEGKTCYLAHFFGNNQYIKVDSSKAQSGELLFKGNEALKGGIYLVVLSPSKFYDFALNGKDQHIEISGDTTNFVETAKFVGSKENEVLYGYRKFLSQKSIEVEKINFESKSNVATKEVNRTKLDAIQKEVDANMKNLASQNEGTFVGKVIKANIEPELPTIANPKMATRSDSTSIFNYYKSHFFDNIDFSDDRLLRSPFIQSRLERYFKDMVYQRTDSINRDADRILKLAKANPEVYRYTLWWVTNKYENTDIVGLDGVFIHLTENYYLKDANWLDSTQRAKFKERIETIKPLQTGLVFPSLMVADSLGREYSPMQSKTAYTIVHFYDPECGHCKDSAPKLAEFYKTNKHRVTIYNVSTMYEPKKMNNFVHTYKVEDLINTWDSKGRYNFRKNFDVYSTPTNYILDKDKKIIARRIPVDKLEDFLSFYEQQEAYKKNLK